MDLRMEKKMASYLSWPSCTAIKPRQILWDSDACRRIQKVRKSALLGKDLRGVRTHKARKRNP